MRLVIGVDEAGYGPNLGPLVIAANAWSIDSDLSIKSWANELRPAIDCHSRCDTEAPIAIGDSKIVFGATRNLLTLARTVAYFEPLEESLIEILSRLDPLFSRSVAETFYLKEGDWSESLLVAGSHIADVARMRTAERLDGLKIRYLGTQLRIVSEKMFNHGVSIHGNKASLLTYESLQLIANCLNAQSLEQYRSIEVLCDKHGGRRKYAAHLSACWPDWFFEVRHEKPLNSSYFARGCQLPLQIDFLAKADHLIPCALASIFAKWSREVVMQRLNAFWQTRCPSLKPTAGYPVDAKRFAAEIESAVKELDLEPDQWWRSI